MGGMCGIRITLYYHMGLRLVAAVFRMFGVPKQ